MTSLSRLRERPRPAPHRGTFIVCFTLMGAPAAALAQESATAPPNAGSSPVREPVSTGTEPEGPQNTPLPPPAAPLSPTAVPPTAVPPAAVPASAVPASAVPPSPPPPEPAPKDESGPALHVGVGLRAGFEYTQRKISASPLNVRPYLSGQVHKYLKFEANFDSDLQALGSGNVEIVRVLDAVAKVELHDLFNVWGGRFLPPSDRPNLSGPYFQNAWLYPETSRFPAVYAGRDNGLAVWGQVGGGIFKYQFGAFNGGVAESLERFRYAGRAVVNLLDPEPGYYNSSTYYGTKDVLAVGGVVQFQKDASSTPDGAKDDWLAGSIDVLFEKNLGKGGVVTLEGEYYNFDKAAAGESFLLLGSYLVPAVLGIGKLQPVIRYQHYALAAGGLRQIIDTGLNYVIDGHNARVALNWQHVGQDGQAPTDAGQLGIQFQK